MDWGNRYLICIYKNYQNYPPSFLKTTLLNFCNFCVFRRIEIYSNFAETLLFVCLTVFLFRLFPLAQTLTVEQQEEVEEELEVVEEEEEEEAAENSPDASSLHQMLYRVPWMF